MLPGDGERREEKFYREYRLVVVEVSEGGTSNGAELKFNFAVSTCRQSKKKKRGKKRQEVACLRDYFYELFCKERKIVHFTNVRKIDS